MRRKIETKKIFNLPSWPLLPCSFCVRRSRTHFGSFFTQLLYFHASLGWESLQVNLKNRRKGVSKKISTWETQKKKLTFLHTLQPTLPLGWAWLERTLKNGKTVGWKKTFDAGSTDKNFRPLSTPSYLPLNWSGEPSTKLKKTNENFFLLFK